MTLNKILRYFVLVGIFAIPFVALIVAGTFLFPNSFFPFITGKNFTFRIIVELISGAWLILALRDSKTYAPRKSWIMWAIATLLGVMVVADCLSANPIKSFLSNFERMEGYITLVHLALYFLITATMLGSERLWNWFWHTSIGASLFMSFYGLLQLRGEIAIDQGSTRIDGTLGNADYMAIFLLINAFLLIYFLLSRRVQAAGQSLGDKLKMIVTTYVVGFAWFLVFYATHLYEAVHAGGPSGVGMTGVILCIISVVGIIGAIYCYFFEDQFSENTSRFLQIGLYIVAIVLNIWMMIETATRGAALGFGIGLIFTALVLAFFERDPARKAVRNTATGILAVIVLGLVAIFALKNSPIIQNSPALSRLSTLVTTHLVQFADDQGAARFQIWEMALQGVKERPILGWGQESFNYLFYKYYSPQMYAQEPWFDRAHNVVLDWLVDGGVLGLLAYLSLFGSLLYCIWRKSKSVGEKQESVTGENIMVRFDLTDRAVLTGLLIAYFVHNFFVFDNIASYILFFSLLAYGHSIYSEKFAMGRSSAANSVANNATNNAATSMATNSAKKKADSSNHADDSEVSVDTIIAVIIGMVTLAIVYFVNVPGLYNSFTLVDALSPQQGGIEANLALYQDVLSSNGFFSFIGKYEAREQLVQFAAEVAGASSSQVSDSDKTAIYNYAYAQMQEQLKETPNDLRYYYFMGTLLTTYGQYQLALPIWQKAVELSPNRQLMLISLGQDEEQLGDPADVAAAEANFQKAYELDPDYTDAAVLYFSASGQYSKLIPLLQQEAQDPNNAQAGFALAAAYAGDKQNAAAIAELELVASDTPQYADQVKTYIQQVESGAAAQ